MSKGAYRSSYEALVDDADYQALSPQAQAVFHTLKLKLGQYGIAVFYLAALEEIHARMSDDEVRAAVRELEMTKPSGAASWLVRERNVLWLRNGLMFEPYFAPNNEKQQKGATAFALTLPKLKIVHDFAAHYALPMPPVGPTEATTMPTRSRETEREPDTQTESGKDSVLTNHPSPHINNSVGKSEDDKSNRPPLSVAKGKTDKPAEDETDRAIRDFVGYFYSAAKHERKQDVRRQLLASLTESGVPFTARDSGESSRVRAVDALHLKTLMLELIAEQANPKKRLAKRGAAIYMLLLRLRETYTETDSARHKDPARRRPEPHEGVTSKPVAIGDVVAGMRL